jgi:hypothetical protein
MVTSGYFLILPVEPVVGYRIVLAANTPVIITYTIVLAFDSLVLFLHIVVLVY